MYTKNSGKNPEIFLTVSYIFLRESPLHFTLDNVMIIEALCRIEQSC